MALMLGKSVGKQQSGDLDQD